MCVWFWACVCVCVCGCVCVASSNIWLFFKNIELEGKCILDSLDIYKSIKSKKAMQPLRDL